MYCIDDFALVVSSDKPRFYVGCCSVLNLQPDLSGNPFLLILNLYLN